MAPRGDTWLRPRAGIDRLVAVVAGVALAPLVAVLAVAIAVVDRQPPVVGLARVGRHGRPFTMWKLRTMRPVAGAAGSLTLRDDPRVTRLGAALRRHRLDELPQLWNVARGEMALLGPRPEAPEHVDLDSPAWQAALEVRPGIAGPTQVVIHGWEAGIDDTAVYVEAILPHKLAVDRWYGREASPAVDWAVVRSLLGSLRHPDRETAVHRHLDAVLPDTMTAIRDGAAAAR